MTHAERESREGRVPTTQSAKDAAAVAAGLLPPPPGIASHEGKKYLRTIHSCTGSVIVAVDVYAVLKAFGVTCPATAHAVKKLLCAGVRGKGDRRADLVGAVAAVNRAIELLDEEETK